MDAFEISGVFVRERLGKIANCEFGIDGENLFRLGLGVLHLPHFTVDYRQYDMRMEKARIPFYRALQSVDCLVVPSS